MIIMCLPFCCRRLNVNVVLCVPSTFIFSTKISEYLCSVWKIQPTFAYASQKGKSLICLCKYTLQTSGGLSEEKFL